MHIWIVYWRSRVEVKTNGNAPIASRCLARDVSLGMSNRSWFCCQFWRATIELFWGMRTAYWINEWRDTTLGRGGSDYSPFWRRLGDEVKFGRMWAECSRPILVSFPQHRLMKWRMRRLKWRIWREGDLSPAMQPAMEAGIPIHQNTLRHGYRNTRIHAFVSEVDRAWPEFRSMTSPYPHPEVEW